MSEWINGWLVGLMNALVAGWLDIWLAG